MNLSRDLTEKFKEKERSRASSSDSELGTVRSLSSPNRHSVDITAMVLGTNFWPIQPTQTGYAVPRQIQGTYEAFSKYHSEVHS